MNQNFRRLTLLAGSVALASLLTACPGRRMYDPGVTLRFSLPEGESQSGPMAIQAMYTTRDEAGQVVMKPLPEGSGYGYFGGREGSITLNKVSLDKVLADGKCLPYRADKVTRVTEPAAVRSCDINFFVYSGSANSPAQPSSANLRYLTHDTYSYAGQNFTYTSAFSDKGLTSQETGTRRAGWSLVRHLVLHPSDAPNTYRVVRDSVEDSQLNLPITLHAPSDYFTSMGVSTGGAQ